MAVVANTRRFVETPTAFPRYGLFNVANGPLPMPEHAIYGGLEFETGRCVLPTGYDTECAPAAQDTKAFSQGGFTVVPANPFMIRSHFECTAVGMTDERLRRLVFERLAS